MGPGTSDTVIRGGDVKLARKTHIDMLNKVQNNYYAAGLHRQRSEAVFRYTGLELRDRYELLQSRF